MASDDTESEQHSQPKTSPAIERVGILIKQARTAQGLTLRDLAKRCGVSPASISKIELARRSTVNLALADRILTAMDLRLHVETVPLWADIDQAIDEAAALPLAERIKTWQIEFEALVSRFEGIPYLLDGLTAAAVQGAPVMVEAFEIAVPRDDAVLDELTVLLDDIIARRGEGFEFLDPREPGSGYWRSAAGCIRIRLIDHCKPELWVDIDPLPESQIRLSSVRRNTLPPPLAKAHLPVVPLAEIRASDTRTRRILERITRQRR